MTAMALPPLYVVADLDFVGDIERWLQCLAALDALGERKPSALAIQIRAKSCADAQLADVARLARQAVAHVPLVLNGSSRLAVEQGYDGVHWPAARIAANTAATQGAATATIGGLAIRTAAIHSADTVAEAERAGATALVFAPVYAPRWKAVAGAGLDALRQAVAASSLPVYALGGVVPARVAACINAGAHGVAVLSGVMGCPATAAAAERYVESLASSSPSFMSSERDSAGSDRFGTVAP